MYKSIHAHECSVNAEHLKPFPAMFQVTGSVHLHTIIITWGGEKRTDTTNGKIVARSYET